MTGTSYSRADMDAAYEFLGQFAPSTWAPFDMEAIAAALAGFRADAREEERIATAAYMREIA